MKLHEQFSEKDHFTASFKPDLYLLTWFITSSCQLIPFNINVNSRYLILAPRLKTDVHVSNLDCTRINLSNMLKALHVTVE